jgi:phosphonate transport system substrate-binding protein
LNIYPFEWKQVLVLLLILLLFQPASAEEKLGNDDKILIMGVFPIVSGVALFKRFAPLKDYLSKNLGREIRLETARDFPTFVSRTAEHYYDIVITAPHFSVLAADSGDYQIVARPTQDLESLVVVSETSAIKDLSQLAGQKIATPPAPALTTRSTNKYLEDTGLKGDKAPEYLAHKSHNAAYQAVLVNNAAAAIVSNNAVNKALDQGIALRIIGKAPPLPAMATLVSTRLPVGFALDVENALVTMADSDEGRAVLYKVGFPGYISARLKDYDPVRPYKPANSNIGVPQQKIVK